MCACMHVAHLPTTASWPPGPFPFPFSPPFAEPAAPPSVAALSVLLLLLPNKAGLFRSLVVPLPVLITYNYARLDNYEQPNSTQL